MKASRGVGAMVLLVLGCASCGCRAHPASLGLMLVGDVVADADLGDREAELMGKPPSAADEMFGERTDTLIRYCGMRPMLTCCRWIATWWKYPTRRSLR